MKSVKALTIIAFAMVMAVMGQSCSSNPEDKGSVTAILNQIAIDYDESGVWTGAMDPTATINYGDMVFSHNASPGTDSWTGFVASRVNFIGNVSEKNWRKHPFVYAASTYGGLSGPGTPYLVACWNRDEKPEGALTTTPSCSVSYGSEGSLFRPLSVFVTNTSYAYFAMSAGTSFSKIFEPGDYLKLLAYGITADDTLTGPAEIYLANYVSMYDAPLMQWSYFNLESLGVVKRVFFTMESSDNGERGMNTPAFFAIDRMAIMPQ